MSTATSRLEQLKDQIDDNDDMGDQITPKFETLQLHAGE